MPNKVLLQGNAGNTAQVLPNGFLCVQVGRFTEAKKQQITDSSAVNFFKPLAQKQVIITGIIVNTDRNVGVNGSAIDIYETSAADSTTIVTDIISIDQVKNVTTPLLPLFLQTAEGSFINGKADDFNVNITVLGYYEEV